MVKYSNTFWYLVNGEIVFGDQSSRTVVNAVVKYDISTNFEILINNEIPDFSL